MNLRLLIFLFTGAIYGQPGLSWQKTVGGIQNDVTAKIAITSDNHYLIGGTSLSGISGNKTQASRGGSDFWLVKLDDSGNITWQKAIGGSDDDALTSFCMLPDDGILACGSSRSGISADKTEPNRGFGDYWIVKLNATGEIIWQHAFGGNNVDLLRSAQPTADGGFILGGTSASNISGEKSENARGMHSQDYWIVKIDALGVIEWQKTFGGSLGDDLSCILQVADSGYIVGGFSASDANFDKSQNSYGVYDYWVLKLNNTGEIEWQQTLGGDDMDYLKDVIAMPDGYLLGGYSASGISGIKAQDLRGAFDYWIIKLDLSGSMVWQKTIGGADGDFLYSMDVTNDGKIILAGSSHSGISGEKTEASRGSADSWLVKIDTAGNIESQKTFGGNLADGINSIIQNTDNSFIAAGYSRSSISGEKNEEGFGESDFWVVKLDSNILNVQQMESSSIVVYPNPTANLIYINSGNHDVKSAIVYDMMGRTIQTVFNPTPLFSMEIIGDTGAYFLKIISENNSEQVYRLLKK